MGRGSAVSPYCKKNWGFYGRQPSFGDLEAFSTGTAHHSQSCKQKSAELSPLHRPTSYISPILPFRTQQATELL